MVYYYPLVQSEVNLWSQLSFSGQTTSATTSLPLLQGTHRLRKGFYRLRSVAHALVAHLLTSAAHFPHPEVCHGNLFCTSATLKEGAFTEPCPYKLIGFNMKLKKKNPPWGE